MTQTPHTIGMIMIRFKDGKFVPMIGYEVTGDAIDGPLFFVVTRHLPVTTAEEAIAALNEVELGEKLLTPVKAEACSLMGMIWLNDVRRNQKPV